MRLHPVIEQSVFGAFAKTHTFPAKQSGGVSAHRFAVDARQPRPEWDVYVGALPFHDIRRLVRAGAIEPWDEYIPGSVLQDLDPAIRRESTFEGKLYSWPFLLDVTVQGWNSELVERAGLDPGRPPASWDEYIENARTVARLGAAPYGCTFDARGWRSLVPITYTFETNVYTDDGLFDYTDDAVVEALEVLRRMLELANPDVLDRYTTAGAGITSDEGAFASQLAAYYVKYQNAHIRAANTWPDPARLALASLPRPKQGSGAALFWTTGITLARRGSRKRAAADYAETLTHDFGVWRGSIGKVGQGSGHLPCFRSILGDPGDQTKAWVPDWARRAFGELRQAAPIKPHRLGTEQFTIAQPYVEGYLTGIEKNPRRALRSAMRAVRKAT